MKTASLMEKLAQKGLDAELVRKELNRILTSKPFRSVSRLQKFLDFIVEEALADREERLKEFLIAVEVSVDRLTSTQDLILLSDRRRGTFGSDWIGITVKRVALTMC